MQWIKAKEILPEQDSVVLVCNVKGWIRNELALFYKREEVFIKYDPGCPKNYPLDVTHWLPIPELPYGVD